MIAAQNQKVVAITPPGALLDGASATTAEIDTKGYDYMQVIVHLGTTNTAMTALAVTESDTSGSGHANVTGLVFGTSADIEGTTSTLPAATDDDGFFIFDIDLHGRKRYIDVTATNNTTSTGGYITIIGVLSRAEEAPITNSTRGAVQVLRV
jgi:hypothetical protein